jgi:uncharacterized protein YbjT (DUF2867 family)
VLVLGASGFLGAHIAAALEVAGHDVIRGVRVAPARADQRCVVVDYARDHRPDDWLARLAGVDAVVNAVGILRERGAATFEALHVKAPSALFTASVRAGVRRVVQISALGADDDARSRYHRSKKQADEALMALSLSAVVIQPSLVYGEGGASARLFTTLAALPVIPLPGEGTQEVQPIHIDDLTALVVRLIAPCADVTGRIKAVGPRALTVREWLCVLRTSMGLPAPRFLRVPMALVQASAALSAMLPHALLDRDTLGMLQRGNVGSPQRLAAVLGHLPRDPTSFVATPCAPLVATAARLGWLLPLLRAAVATLWIITGIVSLGVYPVTMSYELLARTGITGAAAVFALYGAAVLDLALGVAVYVVRRRRWLWRAQIALVLLYTVIITVKLPEYWLHPYGPLTKNLPLLAALLLLHELDRDA